MPAGRPAIPKALNDLQGDRGKRRRYQREPEPPKGVPDCPQHLDEIAKAKWFETANILQDMNVLSKADGDALELYCSAYARYRKAQDDVKKFGGVVVSAKNKVPFPSPWAKMLNDAFDQLTKMQIQFGLTPAARARMSVKEDKWEDDTDKFLRFKKPA